MMVPFSFFFYGGAFSIGVLLFFSGISWEPLRFFFSAIMVYDLPID